MSHPGELVLTIGILFTASTVHAGFGFGTALIAMPLLVLVLGLQTATPLVGFATLTTIIIVLLREWRSADFVAARQLLIASLFGIPCGVWLFQHAPAGIIKMLLGVLLITFSVFNLWRPLLPRWPVSRLVHVFGFAAGVLGGAYNTNGPPIVIYGALARWPPARFRATVQGYFLPAALIICATHGVAGLWSQQVLILYAWAMPFMLVGNALGAVLSRHLDVAHFSRALYVVLGLLGLVMLL